MNGRAESIYRVMRADRGSGKGQQQMEEASRQRDQGKGNKEGGGLCRKRDRTTEADRKRQTEKRYSTTIHS